MHKNIEKCIACEGPVDSQTDYPFDRYVTHVKKVEEEWFTSSQG